MCPGWVWREREPICCLIAGWHVVREHGNQLSHEEIGGGGWSWEMVRGCIWMVQRVKVVALG